jgi:hypothetical protein
MAEVTSNKRKTPQKAALSWEELLVERVLAKIYETNRQIDKSAERFEREMMEKNRQINESAGRFEQRMKDSVEQAGREMREGFEMADMGVMGSFEQIGRRTNRINGFPDNPNRFSVDSVSYIDLPNLMQKFQELGFIFERSYKDAVINDKKNHIYFKIDITLEGGDKILIVEARTKPTARDITGHIERMKKVRQYGNLHGEKRKYIGAIFGIDFNDNEKLFAMKNGFYTIELSGNSFNITAPGGVYFPVEW